MKRNIIITGIVAAAIMVMVFACSKENATHKPETKHELTVYETHINKTLKDFKQKMEYVRANPQLKSGESVTADSTIWLLEATINFSHAFPNEFYNEFETDSLTLTVNRNADGTVDMNELTNKYDEMKQAVAEAYHNSGYEVKGLAVVDIEEATITADQIEINVQVLTGEKSNEPSLPAFNGPFAEGDDWWYGMDEGMCYQQVYTSDAAKEIRKVMDSYIKNQNTGLYFIRQKNADRKGGDFNIRRNGDPNPPNNIYDYYMYSSSTLNGNVTSDILCLSWQEMNVYYKDLEYLLYTKIPLDEMPVGYQVELIIGFEGTWEYIGSQPPWDYHYYHEGSFKYGYPIGYDEGDGPEEL